MHGYQTINLYLYLFLLCLGPTAPNSQSVNPSRPCKMFDNKINNNSRNDDDDDDDNNNNNNNNNNNKNNYNRTKKKRCLMIILLFLLFLGPAVPDVVGRGFPALESDRPPRPEASERPCYEFGSRQTRRFWPGTDLRLPDGANISGTSHGLDFVVWFDGWKLLYGFSH